MREILRPELRSLTTLGMGGTCELLLEPETAEEMPQVFARIRSLGLPFEIIGRGSNILALDGHHPLVLVKAPRGCEPTIVGSTVGAEAGERKLVRVGAGRGLPGLLAFARDNGLSGLEGLAGIPGSVGGAVAMNAGSFGTETCARLHSVTVWQDGRLRCVPAEKTSWSYREFTIDGKRNFLVMDAIFALTAASRNGIAQLMTHNFVEKKSRQPVSAKSAGCVFRNPPSGLSAGVLLDKAGFRGKSRGGAQFSELHANFLINKGGATATDALALLEEAREAVASRFGILLEKEVRLLPCRF